MSHYVLLEEIIFMPFVVIKNHRKWLIADLKIPLYVNESCQAKGEIRLVYLI